MRKNPLYIIGLSLLIGLMFFQVAYGENEEPFEILVKYAPSSFKAADAHKKEGIEKLGVRKIVVDTLAEKERMIAALKEDESVEYIEENIKYSACQIPNDELYDHDWGLSNLNAAAGWDLTTGNSEVIIAVLDTGLLTDYADLTANRITGKTFITGTSTPYDDNDDHHGTNVSAIIAAQGNNGLDKAGVTWHSKVMPLKVLDSNGDGYTDKIAEAIIYAADQDVDVINMSLGGDQSSNVLEDAVEYAYNKGVIMVAASGNHNEGIPPVSYPAAYDHVLAIGAIDQNETIAYFSNTGYNMGFVAPGVDITSYNGQKTINGTSFAAPYVSGTVALMLSLNPQLTFEEIQSILISTAKDLGLPGFDEKYGYGLINIYNVLKMIASEPVITHEPITMAAAGKPLQIEAQVTDENEVEAVLLYYKPSNGNEYFMKEMVPIEGDIYTAVIEGTMLQQPELDYYIEASNGIQITHEGTADNPFRVTVMSAPVIECINSQEGPAAGGSEVMISGFNFQQGAQVKFGDVLATDITANSDTSITVITPPHYPSWVDVTVINPDGLQDRLTQAFMFKSEGVTVSIPDRTVYEGQLVRIPLNISDVSGLRSVDLQLSYDEKILQLIQVTKGSLTADFELGYNRDQAGQLILSMASPTAVYGAGVLNNLYFNVLNTEAATSALHMDDISLNSPGSIPVSTTNGTIYITHAFEISGNAGYYKGDKVLSNVTLELAGDKMSTTVTDATGAYRMKGITEGEYTLTASKEDEVDGISAYDASLILQSSAGLLDFSIGELIAGDVDHDETISAMDASYVLEKAVGLRELPFPGLDKMWTFLPEQKTYTDLNSNKAAEDFTGILIGDVSGNWGELEAAVQSISEQVEFTLGTVRTQPGGQVVVPLLFDAAQENLYGIDISISYDQNVAIPVSVIKSDLADELSLGINLNTQGVIKMALAGAQPLTGQGKLMDIVFDTVQSAGLKTDIKVDRVEVNETNASAIHNGQVIISIAGDADLNNTVDVLDLALTANQYGLGDQAVDLNHDGIIDLYDLVIISKHLGNSYL